MLLWYSQEARGYALFALLAAVSALYFVRALDRGRRADLDRLGDRLGAGARDPLLRLLPDRGRGALAAAAPRPGERWPGFAIVVLAGLALAPLAIHQASIGHAEWIADHALGHRLWVTAATFMVGETGEIIARPETPLPAIAPFLLAVVGAAPRPGARRAATSAGPPASP